MKLSELLEPWADVIVDQVPGVELFDAHTHLGRNDPDGMRQSPEELLQLLRLAHARGAFVFPMHEPDGYSAANDEVLEAAGKSGGMLVPFCRINPHQDPVSEAERCLAAGARGIKLHPRAEQFTLDHPGVRALVAVADERTLPVLIHAGRGIPALGLHAVALAEQFPQARLILAHAAVSDLSWIWRVAPDHANLFFDTSWWIPADMLTLLSLVPPGQILFASDAPYGATGLAAAYQLRSALQVGLSAKQIRSIASAQALRIVAGEAPEPHGPAVGEQERASHSLLDRVGQYLMLAAIASMRGSDPTELVALSRLACDVPDDIDDAPVFAAVRWLLDRFDAYVADYPEDRRRLSFLILACTLARTPDVPIPPLAELDEPVTPDFAPKSAATRSA